MLSTTAANIAPMQGEYTGSAVPHMLLLGRRGQPFFWSPFQNAAGNHNVAVFGKSGSGKSVFLQDVCAAMSGAGAKVIVIDDGRSFEHMAKAFGGALYQTLDTEKRHATFAAILPWLRGQVSKEKRFIGTIQDDEKILRFVNSKDAPRLAELGTSCPDHFLRTKIKPLYVNWNPQSEDAAALKTKLAAARSATLGGKQTTASLSGGNADEGTNDPQGKLRAQFPSDERGQKAYEAYLKRNPDAAAKA